jgi:hypothetical protein
MKNAQTVLLVLGLALLSAVPVAGAKETVDEKVEVSGNTAKRGAKKALHRTEEALCLKGDLKCTAEKAGHRIIEAKDATVDEAKKIKNKVD